jgi:hypothetical protein
MAKIFLSHSSKDKDFVRRLATDLAEMGHTPWRDEEQIKAGDSIVRAIDEAVRSADYVVIVLSSNSVQSSWFATEWEAKLWQEINQRRTMVIPALIDDCEIPALLKPKRYADFRKSYGKGLVELMGGIAPSLLSSGSESTEIAPKKGSREISSILSQVQSRSTTLGQCLTQGLQFAAETGDHELESFCRQELRGWEKKGVAPPSDVPTYRIMQTFLSVHEINLQTWAFNNIQDVFVFMRRNPDKFFPHKAFVQHSVPWLESQEVPDPRKAMIHFQTTAGQTLWSDRPEFAKVPIWIYARSDAYRDVLEAIRQRFTELLLDRLPRVDAPPDE